MDSNGKNCLCNGGEFVVLACSGASDVGHLTDLVARRLRDNNQRSMKCLAMAAAGNLTLLESLKSSNVLVIDGCSVDCSKKIMEKEGVTNFNHIRLSDWGCKKGQSSATPELIKKLYEKVVLYC